jgi:hypothetical protein
VDFSTSNHSFTTTTHMPKCCFSAGSDDCMCSLSSNGGGCPNEISVKERRRRSGDLQPTPAQAWLGHFIHHGYACDSEKRDRRKALVAACCSTKNAVQFLETTYVHARTHTPHATTRTNAQQHNNAQEHNNAHLHAQPHTATHTRSRTHVRVHTNKHTFTQVL